MDDDWDKLAESLVELQDAMLKLCMVKLMKEIEAVLSAED